MTNLTHLVKEHLAKHGNRTLSQVFFDVGKTLIVPFQFKGSDLESAYLAATNDKQTPTLLATIRQSARILACFNTGHDDIVDACAYESLDLAKQFNCNDIAIARALRHYTYRYLRYLP
jgi:hypothetical protein